MQRIKKTSINTGVSAIRFLVQLFMQFAVRTVFISILGRELLGLESLFQNIIQILNIAELGIGAAMGYSMYKPAAENDIEKLKSYDALFRKTFALLALVVLTLGLIIMPFIPNLIKGSAKVGISVSNQAGINIFIIYSMFLLDSVISYFTISKRTLLFVFQQQYLNMLVMSIKLIFVGLIQILILLGFKNYYLYATAIPLATLLECIATRILSKKIHPLIKGKSRKLDKESKSILIKNVSALSLHKISGAVVTTIDSILVSIFFGLSVLGIFSNYILIILALNLMISLLLQSVQASVGNMIASVDKEENYSMFKTLNLGYWFLIGFISICLFSLIQPFISVWIGEDWRFEFVIMLTIVSRFFVFCLRGGMCNVYKDASGLMRKDWWRALLETLLNITLSLILLRFLGLIGIFLGAIIASVLTCVWTEPFIVFKFYFKKSVLPYYLRLILFCLATIVLATISYYLCSLLPNGIIFLAVRLVICGSISIIGYCLFYGLTRDFKNLIGTIKTIFTAIRKK